MSRDKYVTGVDAHAQTSSGDHDHSGQTDPSDPMLGAILDGRYLITSRIARGGMATVYEALDRRLDRIVALKVMRPGMGDDRAYAARFVGEARAAARLDHPNVVKVFDQGPEDSPDGVLYLVMELVKGTTLRDQMHPGVPIPPEQALSVLEPVLSALAAAHRAGLVHRDIKPENVLIASQAEPGTSPIKVADFGLARAVTAQTQHTSTGVLIGTVSYVAPEIVMHGRADQRSDVYSAGVMLYELLTGKKPHEGESPIQVAYKHVHEDIPAPSEISPSLPPYVDALVQRATARDPFLRPADADVMLRQVQRVRQALHHGVTEDVELTADLAIATRTIQPDAGEPEATSIQHFIEAEATTIRSRQERTLTTGMSDLPEPRRRRRRGPLWVLLAVLLVAAIGVGAWWFGFARYTSVPGVIGLSQADATSKLAGVGLEVGVGEPDWSDTIAAGLVMDSDPAGGDRALDGSEVTLTLSKGPEIYPLPNLAGKTLDEAKGEIDQLGMSFGRSTEAWSESVPKDQVIRTVPKAGTELRPGSNVDVIMSKGREPIEVSDWTGKSAAQAEKALKAAGLKVKVDDAFDDTVPKGNVISQSPNSGTLFRGDTVTLLKSKGPELVEVPGGLRGSGVADATAKLEALGFHVETVHASLYLGLGYVASSNPGSGTKVPKGSTIVLSLV
jgi:serine/threonine-protein kinase